MKKIYLETFGCQMNVLDSELVESQLRALGYSFTPALDDADVVLYNTCSVRERSEQKVWSRLGRMKERKTADPSLVIGVIAIEKQAEAVAQRDALTGQIFHGAHAVEPKATLLVRVWRSSRTGL